jgi:very-short-patch-repair endonuclease
MHRQQNWSSNSTELSIWSPDKQKYDAQRTRDLEQQGLKVLRFDDRQALLQTESVLEAIFQAVKNPS